MLAKVQREHLFPNFNVKIKAAVFFKWLRARHDLGPTSVTQGPLAPGPDSHLMVCSDEGENRRIRKRRVKENKRFFFFFREVGPLVGDDVDGFPLSNTKPCTVYHEFHVFDSDSPPAPPPLPPPPRCSPFHPLDAPNTVPFVSTGGGTAVMSVTNQHKEGCVSVALCVCGRVCVQYCNISYRSRPYKSPLPLLQPPEAIISLCHPTAATNCPKHRYISIKYHY